MGFLIMSCFWWYAHGFFDASAHLLSFCCYTHGLFDLFLLLMVCSWFFCCFGTLCSFLLLCSWVFWSFLVFDGLLMGFLIFCCFRWCAHGFLISTNDLNSNFRQIIATNQILTADLSRWSQQLISTDELNRLVGKLVDWIISLSSQPQPPSPQTPYHTTCGLIGIYIYSDMYICILSEIEGN